MYLNIMLGSLVDKSSWFVLDDLSVTCYWSLTVRLA